MNLKGQVIYLETAGKKWRSCVDSTVELKWKLKIKWRSVMPPCLLTCNLDYLYLPTSFGLFCQLPHFLLTESNLLSLPFLPRCLSCPLFCPALPSSVCLSTLPSATTSLHPSNLSDSLIHPSLLPLFLLSLSLSLSGRPPTLPPICKRVREREGGRETKRGGERDL